MKTNTEARRERARRINVAFDRWLAGTEHAVLAASFNVNGGTMTTWLHEGFIARLQALLPDRTFTDAQLRQIEAARGDRAKARALLHQWSDY